jgi:hypothetical protein
MSGMDNGKYMGFDLIDGRYSLAARFDAPLPPRDSEWLLAQLDGLQWTEAQVLKVTQQFADECGYSV